MRLFENCVSSSGADSLLSISIVQEVNIYHTQSGSSVFTSLKSPKLSHITSLGFLPAVLLSLAPQCPLPELVGIAAQSLNSWKTEEKERQSPFTCYLGQQPDYYIPPVWGIIYFLNHQMSLLLQQLISVGPGIASWVFLFFVQCCTISKFLKYRF